MVALSTKATAVLTVAAALLFLSLTAAADTVAAPNLLFSDVYFVSGEDSATPAPTEEAEVNHHVGRVAAIFFSVFGSVWLILSLSLAYVFIRVCPDQYTK